MSRSFSLGMHTIRHVCDLPKTDEPNDILSLWQCSETGTTYGYYTSSGLRAITPRLFSALKEVQDNSVTESMKISVVADKLADDIFKFAPEAHLRSHVKVVGVG